MSERMSDERLQHIKNQYERWGEAALERACGELLAEIDALRAELAKAERERDSAREALGRLVSEYDDDGEHGIHAYEQECPLCCAIEDARNLVAALKPTPAIGEQ